MKDRFSSNSRSRRKGSEQSGSDRERKESETMGAERRRISDRKSVDFIHVTDLTSMNTYGIIAKNGYIVDASPSGFLLKIKRSELVPISLKENLTLQSLTGQQVVLFLPEMNLDLDGTITRTSHKGRGDYEIAVEFSEEIPAYWRECLVDLLPQPGELEEEL
ncbi:hypothetical protein OAQ84_01245 [Bdellovibrionales bacterium]|nr:hypothetical protein [Bdellovibrionales bacterium]